MSSAKTTTTDTQKPRNARQPRTSGRSTEPQNVPANGPDPEAAAAVGSTPKAEQLELSVTRDQATVKQAKPARNRTKGRTSDAPALGQAPAPAASRPAEKDAAGVSYAAAQAGTQLQQAVAVQLRKMEIVKNTPPKPSREAAPPNEDIRSANAVAFGAATLASKPAGSISRFFAEDMVIGDVSRLRNIRDQQARTFALYAMAKSSEAQPLYRAELERQAPELIAPSKAAFAEIEAMKPGAAASMRDTARSAKVHAENMIERGTPRQRAQSPSQEQVDPVVPPVRPTAQATETSAVPPQPALGLGKRFARAMGSAAQAANTWLHDRAKEIPARASTAAPVPPIQAYAQAAIDADTSTRVPISVTSRFLRVDKDYYFPDRTPAFTDHGSKLATRGAHHEVVRSLIEIAKARNWESVTVRGTEEFRRSAWMEAAQSGLHVAGYKPSALDLAELQQRPARNSAEKGLPREPPPTSVERPQATVRSPAQAPARETALNTAAHFDHERAAKARSFETDKPAFVVKKHPDLAPAYGVMDAAKKFAEANLPAAARDEFVGIARRHVIQKIIAGEAVKGPQIHMAQSKAKDAGDRDHSPLATADLGKSPRSKEAARER